MGILQPAPSVSVAKNVAEAKAPPTKSSASGDATQDPKAALEAIFSKKSTPAKEPAAKKAATKAPGVPVAKNVAEAKAPPTIDINRVNGTRPCTCVKELQEPCACLLVNVETASMTHGQPRLGRRGGVEQDASPNHLCCEKPKLEPCGCGIVMGVFQSAPSVPVAKKVAESKAPPTKSSASGDATQDPKAALEAIFSKKSTPAKEPAAKKAATKAPGVPVTKNVAETPSVPVATKVAEPKEPLLSHQQIEIQRRSLKQL